MRSRILHSLLLAAACTVPGPCAIAQALDGAPPEAEAEAGTTPFGAAPLDGAALESLRGGEASVDTSVLDQGQVDGNTATGIASGLNSVDGGAFGNAAGISTVIQNSGSNVLIQNGTAVNVQFVDPTP